MDTCERHVSLTGNTGGGKPFVRHLDLVSYRPNEVLTADVKGKGDGGVTSHQEQVQ